jgi:hypothetical protein
MTSNPVMAVWRMIRMVDLPWQSTNKRMAVWRMNCRADLPWQSANKRSLKIVMCRDVTGLLEMAVCCAKPPYASMLSCTSNLPPAILNVQNTFRTT